jgi:hypothetical protein
MKRTMIGAVWGMIFYLFGHAVVGLIVGSPAVDAWRPLIALVAVFDVERSFMKRIVLCFDGTWNKPADAKRI